MSKFTLFTLHVLFAQRNGETSPEALAIADEVTMDLNPDFMAEKFENAKRSTEFTAVRVIPVDVNSEEICRILNHTPTIEGVVAVKDGS